VHPDLVAISNLWQVDHQNDQLREEHERLAGATRAAAATLKAAEASTAAAVGEVERVRGATRSNDRELADYVDKRDRTRKMIDTGTAPDYGAAERQLAQVLEIVDRLETNALELLEATENAAATLAEAKRDEEKATAALAEARAALAARDAPIRAELTELIARRPPLLAEVPAELRSTYAQLRQRKRPALVNTADNTCRTCQTRIPTQRVVETTFARAIHNCPGCGAWLLP
jgi:predicted  nucleic acid-binding Zn-ribbon protein